MLKLELAGACGVLCWFEGAAALCGIVTGSGALTRGAAACLVGAAGGGKVRVIGAAGSLLPILRPTACAVLEKSVASPTFAPDLWF